MVREGSVNIGGCFDCGWTHIFVAGDNEDVGSFGEGCDGSRLDREQIGRASVGLAHLGEDGFFKILVSLVDSGWDVPGFRLPVGPNVDFWVVFFFGDEGSTGEEYLREEVLVEPGERCGGILVWSARGGAELKA